MTMGRSNSEASETRNSVSWKVERAPNSGKNCFGRTSREAGHSRVPAPPHMINGIIRPAIGPSNAGSGASLPVVPRGPQYPVARLLPDRPQNHTKADENDAAAPDRVPLTFFSNRRA